MALIIVIVLASLLLCFCCFYCCVRDGYTGAKCVRDMFTCCMTKEKEDDDGTESKNILRQKTKELEKVMR